MVIVEVFDQLLFSAFVVGFPAPYLHFDDVLMPEVIDNHVGAQVVAGTGFDIIIPDAVDDRLDVKHEVLAAFFLDKFRASVAVDPENAR